MRPPLIEARFYETYYFASAVRNILCDQLAYLHELDEFYGDDRHLHYTAPFPRSSAFHSFLHHFIGDMLAETDVKLDVRQDNAARFASLPAALDPHPSILPINEALLYHDLEHVPFEDWLKDRGKSFLEASDDDISDYLDDLRLEGPIDDLLDRVTSEAFFVLFPNRRLMLLFNDMMARQVQDSDPALMDPELAVRFAAPGVLKRVRLPEWVKRAVFFRDRGRCVICRSDLSRILSISNAEHFDHVVPLALGGLNDVTNIQLLCGGCNLKKRDGEPVTSDVYEAWYPSDGPDEA